MSTSLSNYIKIQEILIAGEVAKKRKEAEIKAKQKAAAKAKAEIVAAMMRQRIANTANK